MERHARDDFPPTKSGARDPPPRTIRDDVRDNSTSTKVTTAAVRAIKHRAALPKATESARVARRGNINLSGVLRSDRGLAAHDRARELQRLSSFSLSLSLVIILLLLRALLRARARYLETRSLGARARARASGYEREADRPTDRSLDWKTTPCAPDASERCIIGARCIS